MKKWYEQLFENYAEAYDREPFTQGTKGEVDFIEAGFKTVDIYGARLGTFSRKDALTPDDFEMLVVAGKWARANPIPRRRAISLTARTLIIPLETRTARHFARV